MQVPQRPVAGPDFRARQDAAPVAHDDELDSLFIDRERERFCIPIEDVRAYTRTMECDCERLKNPDDRNLLSVLAKNKNRGASTP